MDTIAQSCACDNQLALMSGTAFWSWAILCDAQWRVDHKDKADPFKGHEIPKGGGEETAGEKREAYTVAELRKLHKAAQGCKRRWEHATR